jgi:hypothetical protein
MLEVTATVNKTQMKELMGVIRRTHEETGRDVRQSILRAAVDITASFRRICKPKQRKKSRFHQVEKNPEFLPIDPKRQLIVWWALKLVKEGKVLPPAASEALREREKKLNWPFRIVRLKQSGDAQYGYTNRADFQAPIRNWGLARQTWHVMRGKLASLKGAPADAFRDPSSANEYRGLARYAKERVQMDFTDTGKVSGIHMVNKLSYIEAAYPGSTEEAIARAIKSATYKLDNQIEQRLKKESKAA